MTKANAAELLVNGAQQVDPPLCEHLKIELERNEIGGMTGNYHCTTWHFKLGLERTEDSRLTRTYRCLECGRPYATHL